MKPSNPLVSIIIPCYNAATWIREAIDSCLCQTYSPIKIIVIDDGSTDNSLAIIKSFGNHIRYETGPNRGGSAARNRGFELSNGQYVLFLDADDLILTDTIEMLVKALSKTDNCRCIAACDWWFLVHQDGKWITRPGCTVDNPPPGNDYIRGWLSGWFIPPGGILWTRPILNSVGGWDETITYNDDGDLMLRALLNGVQIERVQGGGLYYRHLHNKLSVSTTLTTEAIVSYMRVLEKVERKLVELGKVQDYAVTIAQAYHGMATWSYPINRDLARQSLAYANQLAGANAISGSIVHRALCGILGVEGKLRLVELLKPFGLPAIWRKMARGSFR